MPSYVIYARKSTESDDQQVLSIGSQIHEMKSLAHRHRVTVGEILTESRSAKEPGRPVFGALMRRVRRGEVNGILCWKMDRLARNHYDTGQVLQALADQKLERIVTSDGVKTSNSNDRLLGTFEFALATKYIDDLRQNVLRGNRARFEKGWPNFRPPPGYLEDRTTKTTIDDPERFDLMRRVWDLTLTDTMRIPQIHRILNNQWGYRSRKTKRQGGKPMALSSLYRLLRDPFYMGIIRLKSGATYKGGHRPMVTPEEFERVQTILGRSARPRPSRHEFAYSGLLHCANCKRVLVGEQHVKPSGTRFVYYRCHRNGNGTLCREPALPERRFEEQVLADLRRTALHPEAVTWIHDNLRASLSTELAQLTLAQTSRHKALEQAKAEATKLLDLSLRGMIDDQTFAARHSELQDRQTRLELESQRPTETPEQLLARVDSLLTFSQRAPEVFVSGTPVQRRQIVAAVCSNPEVRGRKGLYKANEPFSFFEGSGLISSWCTIVEDLRTWILEESQECWIPSLDGAPPVDTMTEDAYAA
jgi:DNA invertase Pin-like site-specific DNA recombinase